MDDKECDCDADARIGYVEGGPGVEDPWGRRSQIEQKKIDDVAVKETIGQVAEDAGQQQAERDVAPFVRRSFSQKQNQNNQQGDTRNSNEKFVVVLEGTERSAGIRNVYEMEEPFHHRMRFLGVDILKHQILCQLIQRVEREGEEKDVFHCEVLANAQRPTPNAQRPMQTSNTLSVER
jgi:hypothetical protein